MGWQLPANMAHITFNDILEIFLFGISAHKYDTHLVISLCKYVWHEILGENRIYVGF